MAIVTLTTDWGIRDYYAAALKGALLSADKDFNIVDISHQVDAYDILKASFVFRNSFYHFPAETIHLVSVCSQQEKNASWLAIRHNNHFIVCRDDGFFSLISESVPEQCVMIDNSKNLSPTEERAHLAGTALHISQYKGILNLGQPVEDIKKRNHIKPVVEDSLIRGTVIYVDEFGNAITNIEKNIFDKVGRNRRFEIDARRQEYIISKIDNSYEDAGRGNLLALFNSANMLEIAINQGNASGLIGLEYGAPVRIMFL